MKILLLVCLSIVCSGLGFEAVRDVPGLGPMLLWMGGVAAGTAWGAKG